MDWNCELIGNEEVYKFSDVEEMIKSLKKSLPKKEQKCLHEGCHECHGTGRKKRGENCIHHLSCPCPRCSPRM